MNVIGGGLIGALLVPIAITVTFCVLRRWSAALYFLLATVVSAGLVQLLKNVYDRPRPIDILVTSDLGSFPSGHVANAATMAVVLGVILQRKWVWVVGVIYAIAMMISRTYLGAHWLSDTIGGLVLGAAVGFGFAAPFAHRLHVERPKAAPGNAQPKG
jgi:undecaprenyl-diphosphatase